MFVHVSTYMYICVDTYVNLINYLKDYRYEKEQEGVYGRIREKSEKRNVAIILSSQKCF